MKLLLPKPAPVPELLLWWMLFRSVESESVLPQEFLRYVGGQSQDPHHEYEGHHLRMPR